MAGKTLVPIAMMATAIIVAPSLVQATGPQASGSLGPSAGAPTASVGSTLQPASDPRLRRARTGKIKLVARGNRLGKKRTRVTLAGIKGQARGTEKRVRLKKSKTIRRLPTGRYRVLGKTVTTAEGTATAKQRTVRVTFTRTRRVVLRYVPIDKDSEQASPPVAGEAPSGTPDELEVLRLTNVARSTATNCGGKIYSPAAPLTWNSAVAEVARAHSEDMAANSYFSHTDLTGGGMGDRLARAGVAHGWAGENIAAGYPTAADVVEGWLDSPGHCVNIMRSAFTEMGVGYAVSIDGVADYGNRWTQVFINPSQ